MNSSEPSSRVICITALLGSSSQPASRGPAAAGRHERASLRQLRLSARCILLSFTPLPFSLSPAKCVAGLRCCLQGADSRWAWGEEPKPEYLQKMQFIAKGRAAAGHSPPGWTRRGTPQELEEGKDLLSKVSSSTSRGNHSHRLTQILVVSQPDSFFSEILLITASPFSHLISPGTPRGKVISL